MEPEKIAPPARHGETKAEVVGSKGLVSGHSTVPRAALSEKPGGQAMGELETKLITM